MSSKFKVKKHNLIPYVVAIFCFFGCYVMPKTAQAEFKDLFQKHAPIEEVLVLKVVASDSIILENGQRIKLLGIDSFGPPPRPKVQFDEKGKPIELPPEPTISLEEQAIAYAQSLMEGKKVKLEYDLESRDDKGNKTAYVYLADGTLVNVEMLRQGFVRLHIRPPNVKHEDLLKKAYQEARKEQRGFLSY